MWSGLLKVGKEMHSLDRKRILTIGLVKLNDTLGLSGSITRILGDDEESGLVTSFGLTKEDLRSGLPEIDETALTQENPVILDSEPYSAAVSPITYRNKILGVLYAYSRAKEFPNEALQMIKAFAGCIGVALENERRYRAAMRNWHEAIEELWSKMDVWGTPGKFQNRK